MECSTQNGIMIFCGGLQRNKTFSISIRVSEEELQKLKQAAKIESYASYSEFMRRTALKEADKVIRDSEKSGRSKSRNSPGIISPRSCRMNSVKVLTAIRALKNLLKYRAPIRKRPV